MDAAPSPVILVAAGSAGFGAQVASTFAQQGYRVVINYNSNSERAEKLLAQISGQEGDNPSTSTTAITFRYIALCADLSAQFEIQRLVHGTYKIMGRIDVVLSNGGWSRFRDTSSIDDNVCEEDWDRAFGMNVKSHLCLLHTAKPRLEEVEGSFILSGGLSSWARLLRPQVVL